ncbi:MAG: cell division protein FtsZ [Candidatus Paceibacterota bacterium]
MKKGAKKAVKKSKKTAQASKPKKVKAKKALKSPKATPSTNTKITNSQDRVRIKVFGVGGGGGNALSRMKRNSDIRGIEFIAVNTDAQDLEKTDARRRIHIGKKLTRGLGTGMNPDLGEQAAEENRAELTDAVKGADLVFITAGLGGGTGSGASPIVAEISKEEGALTIAIVTKPFTFEGVPRAQVAEKALERLKDKVDAIIVVPNDKIFEVTKKETPIMKAFERIDDVLKDAIKGITELISSAGIINVDFSDVKAIMSEAGSALVGVGEATGQNRASIAANIAINSPLLEFSTDGARGLLFGISGGRDVRMSEINEIARHITNTTDPNAKVIFGAYHDRRLKKGSIKVTLIATGFDEPRQRGFDTDSFFQSDTAEEDIIDLTSERAQKQSLFKRERTVQEEKEEIADQLVDNTRDFRKEDKKKKPVISDLEEKETDDAEPEVEEAGGEKDSPWDIPAFLRRKKKD